MKTSILVLSLAALAACSQAPDATTPAAATATAPSPSEASPAAPAAQASTEDAGTPLAVGSNAPQFSTQAWLAGEPFQFNLADALASGPVVVYFFPAAFTPGCNIEARLFSEAIDQFKAKGATVIGVTAGNTDQLQAFSSDNETCSGKFAVAADADAAIARQYGAILAQKPEWSSRTSFAIGRDGRILKVYSDSKPSEHVAQMLAGLES